ncbi:MAG: gliding motility-associated C-terminal domain-containing protein [Bacteroidales bacterium]|nr:gliding motility-associated C-terminal domain-containing protein [Bacteroidales bacterium]
MRKINIVSVCVVLFTALTSITNAQVVVSSANGQSAATLVANNFVAEGVELVTTPAYAAKFNGQTTINSNQIGTFTNANTIGQNMPIDAGIVMVTGNCTDAGQGSYSGIESSSAEANSCQTYSPALYQTYHNNGGTQSMNDAACLTFYVIPKNNTLSFKYSFASEEYPNFVCSSFNDVFGLFITGPMDPVTGDLQPGADVSKNIALIPPDYTTPVMINTINNGTSAGSATPCILTNSQYFRMNNNNNCKMNGYTVELSTQTVDVWACYMYKLELAICDIGDQAYNSAVYLKAHSLQSQVMTIDNNPSATNGNVAFSAEGDPIFIKGCSSDTLSLSLAFPEANPYTYTLNVQPSVTGALTQGVDYTISDENGNPTGTIFQFAPGDTNAKLVFDFLHNENKLPGTQDTLLIITEELNYCTPKDTFRIILMEPELFVPTVEGGKTYCANDLPAREFITLKAQNARTFLDINWETSLNERDSAKVYYANPASPTGTLEYQIEVMVNNPVTYTITLSDSCGRSFDTTIVFKIQGATTDASVDRNYICEGESATLSCPQTVAYSWTSFPADATLAGVAHQQNPTVTPTESTTYTVEITDENGCKATDTVRVVVVPAVVPRISLNPHTTTLSNTNVVFEDLTVDGARRVWDFGDGTTSTAISGIHPYSTSDTGIYVVTLVVYNAADCSETITDTVRIKPDFTIYIPNAVQPNSDDSRLTEFKPIGTMEWYRLDIFNRWGAKIFEGKDNQPWDGKLESGELAPQDTYVYDLYYHDGNNLLQRKSGTLLVLPKTAKQGN